MIASFFFFNDTATTEIYTLSLHDALPIYYPTIQIVTFYPGASPEVTASAITAPLERQFGQLPGLKDRKSTRLNSSHLVISYAVFCLKKKKTRSFSVKERQHDSHRMPEHRT